MITMVGYDTTSPKFDKLKYIRQLRGCIKWKKFGAKGTAEYATGFGKSTIAMLLIEKMLRNAKKGKVFKFNNSVIIIVPTNSLKEQWERELEKRNYYHVQVYVINTPALRDGFNANCDLLVVDEIHLAAADKLRNVLINIKYVWILGLTATVNRSDGKDEIIRRVAPVFDTITQREAVVRGWITDFIEFNLSVAITRREAETQVTLGKTIQYFMSKFKDFNMMLACMQREHAINYARSINVDPKDVSKWAVQGMNAIRKRKDFLDTTEHKIDATVELIKEFNVKTITFSQATSFADAVKSKLGEDCETYHSNRLKETRRVEKTKIFKTIRSATTFKTKLTGDKEFIRMRRIKAGYKVIYYETLNLSSSALNKLAIDKFLSNEIQTLAAAKALDQGFDDPSVILGIDGSRTENPATHVQKTGRIGRNYLLPDGKTATKIYVNLYIPDWCVPNSRDEQKLRACQEGNNSHIIWVDSLHELKEMLESIIKKREYEFNKRSSESEDLCTDGTEEDCLFNEQ